MPRMKMQWSRFHNNFTQSGPYAIELHGCSYELWRSVTDTKRHQFVKSFPTLEDAKSHARGLAYLDMETQCSQTSPHE